MRACLPPSISIVRVGQKGNALFLILIAVALFAALSYAVTQTGRGSGTSSREQTALYAAQITQIGADVAMGVQRMTLTGTASSAITSGTPANKLCGGCGTLNGYADYCTSGATCLFAPDGGAVAIPQVPRAAFMPTFTDWGISHYFQGAGSFQGVEIDGLTPGAGPSDAAVAGVGTNLPDDMLQVYPLTQAVCQAIDKGLGFNSIPIVDPVPASWSNGFSGVQALCIQYNASAGYGTSSTFYLYYQVLNAN